MSLNKNEKKDAFSFGKSNGGTLNSDQTRMSQGNMNWGFSGNSIVTNKGDKYSSLTDFKNSGYFKK